MGQFGYHVDLATVKFDDSGLTWVHAMPLGQYDHPVYGDINITPERANQFAANVNNRVREIDLDVDYDHKAKIDEAAGWVKKAEARGDGLWIAVEWTPQAMDKIKSKAYRYFSPEFLDEWTHPKTKVVHKDVMAGGALTNRPFFKDLLPLNMSDLFEEQHPTEGVGMDPKALRVKLGLKEDAADADVEAKLTELVTPPKKDEVIPPKPDPTKNEGDPASLAASEAAAALAKKFSDNPEVKAFFEAQQALLADNAKQREEDRKTMAELRTTARVSQIEARIAGLGGGKYAIPPAVTDKLKVSALQMSDEASGNLFDAFEALTKTGLVPLGERSGGGNGSSVDANAVQKFGEAVEELQKKNPKLSDGDAMSQAAKENPQLFEEYRKASSPNTYAVEH
jgi:phage I-like protein